MSSVSGCVLAEADSNGEGVDDVMAKTMMLSPDGMDCSEGDKGDRGRRSEDMQEIGERCRSLCPSSSGRSCLVVSPGDLPGPFTRC